MRILLVSYRWFITYGVVWAVVITGTAWHNDGGLGAAAPRPTETVLATVTEVATITLPPRTVTLPPSAVPLPAPSVLPSPTAAPTASASPTPTPAPTASRTPRNRAHGLRDGCLIDRHWLLLQPCRALKTLLSLVHRLVSAA